MSETLKSVGTSSPRPDGRAKVTGAALYVDDVPFDGWYGVTVRCPLAKARIVSIDTSALDSRDDVCVVTAKDLDRNVILVIDDDWPVLADEQANHVGEPVVLVAAPSRAIALAAADQIVIEYEELEAIYDLDGALRGDGRVLSALEIIHGDVDSIFNDPQYADRIIEGTYDTGHQEHIYIECNGMIATPLANGGVDLFGSLQCPYYIHKCLTHLFDCEDDQIRVRQAVTGGGFGGKEDFPDVIAAHAALLCKASGHAVKIIYDRHEDIVGTTKRHPARTKHRTIVDDDGKLIAMDIEFLLDGGAYTTLTPVVLSRGAIHAAGPYACPNVRIRGKAYATNTATNGAFRGFGAPQSCFAIERQMDRVARAIHMDPYTIRERNAYRIGDVTPTGQKLTRSVSAMECLTKAVERSDFLNKWKAYEAARINAPDDGAPTKGIGLSLFWHGSGFTGNGERNMMAKASLRLLRGGGIEILTASTDIGQGTEAVFAQVVADAAGVPMSKVRMHQPDTGEVPNSGPTVASRTVMVVGGVLATAGRGIRERLVDELAKARNIDRSTIRYEDGQFIGPNGPLATFAEVGDALLDREGDFVLQEQFQPATDDQGFDEKTYQGAAYTAYGWGCDVVELEVEPDTYLVRPTRVTAVADVGRAIHPVLCAGQVEGGTLQAIAYGYLEEMKLDRGRYLNDRLQTYIVPTTADAPDFDTILVENPAPGGPFGAKGVGELPMDGGAPATVSAIENATGICPSAIPATPERLLADRYAGHVVAEYPVAAE